MRKLFLAFVSALLLITPVRADEGMWLPIFMHLIKGDMEQLGAKITAEDIYSINNSSIKDAIVQMGGFCTGEIVSNQGLVFTNHHCGYDAIAGLSSTDSNYLDDGYWSASLDDEIPVPGLTMKILDRMVDVTDVINNAKDPAAVTDSLVTAAEEGGKYMAEVFDMFYGTEHYLMVYKVFKDIRFVGAPQAAIGKFGGDTDNWMWPRHTGDFSVFRIYAGPDNQPAEYSENNQPYIPEHFLKISLDGYEEGDFAFIMGYPGRTQRYLTAAAAEQIVESTYPTYVKILDKRLGIMKKYMDADEEVRIALAGDYASLANSHKYFKGVVERSKKSDFIDQKRAFEKRFETWASANEKRADAYSGVVDKLATIYDENDTLNTLMAYINFAGFGPEMVMYGLNYFGMQRQITKDEDFAENPEVIEKLQKATDEHFANYNADMDQEMTAAMIRLMYEGLPKKMYPEIFTSEKYDKYFDEDPKIDKFVKKMFRKSILTNKKKADKWLEDPSLEELEEDIGYKYFRSILGLYMGNMMAMQMADAQEKELMGKYITGQREMLDHAFYPDANSTLRFTYGTIKAYPNDEGEMYNHFTTADQILDKYIEGDDEFDVPDALLKLIKNKDYGRYGEDGVLKVNFLSTTDITGGNSGSPIMDANGNLIGIAFDGNWESMLSDLYFEDKVTRTINVDIRYVLFIIDKMADAQHIMDELVIADTTASVNETPNTKKEEAGEEYMLKDGVKYKKSEIAPVDGEK